MKVKDSVFTTYVGERSDPPSKAAEVQVGAIHSCPMHPEVRQAGPGTCPKCGMYLVPVQASSVPVIHDIRKSILAGLAGSAGLVAFYIVLVGLISDSWRHPLDELIELKYWIGGLVLGFGAQVGLFYHIRKVMQVRGEGGKAVAAGTTTSTAAMVACCAHHIADVLPIIGLAGVALFLAEYRLAFIAFGLISNAVGIIIMVRILRNHAAPGRTV